MTTNINVSKQTVVDLLRTGKAKRFVIPEYQRPYAWTYDEIITLFDDIWNFSKERILPNGPTNYFLGSIVSFENENGEQEIIDGQQRLTSLFLLLRAILSRLEKEEIETDEVKNFKAKIKPLIWVEDELKGRIDTSKPLFHSEVATDSGNRILRKIMETGVAEKNLNDNYSRNYNKFLELYIEKSKDSPHHIYQFINSLLNYCILLPISAENQDTALTIFSTLNNRGLPLSDADIFKSTIYKQLNKDEKAAFASKWKDLEEETDKHGESIQTLFYYQMFKVRALEKDEDTTTPGLRKYFLEKGKNRLNIETFETLSENLNLWKVINSREEIPEEPWSRNLNILKILDCLSSNPNEFWKYPVQIFYNTHKTNQDFERLFLKFLRKLCALLATRYLESPTVNSVKGDVLKLNSKIIQSPTPDFSVGFKTETGKELFINPHKSLVRLLLKVLAYNSPEQTNLLPKNWDIEHIFPQKWDDSFFTYSEEIVNESIEHLGNKIPLEKKTNIRASNNYFNKKKELYKTSSIGLAKELSKLRRKCWLLEDIYKRDKEVREELNSLFNDWVRDYDSRE